MAVCIHTATAGSTQYVFYIRPSDGAWWNTAGTPAFETYNASNYADYDTAATEYGTSTGIFQHTVPATLPAGVYYLGAKTRAGGSPAQSDTVTGIGLIQWTGTAVVPLTGDAFTRLGAPAGASIAADLAAIQADLPQRVTKNTALSAFMFVMRNSAGTPTAGLTVTATRSLDGAAFASCTNSVTEVSNGWYKIDLAAADLNANVVALRFTATGAVDTNLTIPTQPT